MAGTLTISTLSDGTNSTSSTNCIQGSAKAWANWNGISGVTIRASYNVSSVTRNSMGNYTINFTSALANANYAPTILCSYGGSTNNWSSGYIFDSAAGGTNPTTSALRIATLYYLAGYTYNDATYINVGVFSS